ncbi:MAG: hypothetical protein AB1728_15755, partial [Bacteroidota bacterium]
WKEYFEESGELFNVLDRNDFEKLQALYKVDFSQIKSNAREVITEEIRRTARAGEGYEVLRSRLRKRGLGEGEVRTLANTALAQFDNATMFEFAQQAGIEKFKYDGVLHENSRPFCREHLGKKFTLEQIRAMDNGQGLPVETSLGGYNCTHFWTPVIEQLNRKSTNKRAVESTTATGIPISSALNVLVRGELKRAVDRGLSLIDQVHGDGKLKVIDVRQSSSRYTLGGFGVNIFNREAIGIHISSKGNQKELTFIHEIGHYLDHSGIGSPKLMASTIDPIMSEWKQAVRKSQAYKNLDEIYKRQYIEVDVAGKKVKRWNPFTQQFFEYLLSDEELWARSYAQFIAHKTRDQFLKEQIAIIRNDPVDGSRQWDDNDFEEIAQAIEKLFQQLGWMI